MGMFLERLIRPRALLGLVFAGCTSMLAYGLYLQHVQGLEPCPMCIMQRYAFVAVAAVALVGALHGARRAGLRVYAALMGAAAVAGGGVAARQSWLQHNPPPINDCGPGLDYMLESFPLAEALPMIFRGSGDCAEVQWTFIGLSIAEWALVAFVAIVGASLIVWLRAPRGDSERQRA
jgi:disulfide bond formation protein DsbB